MHKAESGFSHILIPLLVVGVVVVGSGYIVYRRDHKTTPSDTAVVSANKSTTAGSSSNLTTPLSASTAAGVAANINSLTTSLASNESALSSEYGTSDQTSDTNLGTTATNVGGAYDASNY